MFIVIEGPDGSGKTKAAEGLTAALTEAGVPVLLTGQPSGGAAGQLIGKIFRAMFDGDDELAVHPDAVPWLFLADRVDHARRAIAPRLAAGKTVVCDRYWHSTYVYQGADGDWRWLKMLHAAADLPTPDVTFLLLPNPVTIMERRLARGDAPHKACLPRIKPYWDRYDRLQRELYEDIVYVGADHAVDRVVEEMMAHLRTTGRLP